MYQTTDKVTSAGHLRYANDAYFTVDDRPVPTLFMALPELLQDITGLLEPMCGAGHMAEDLKRHKLAVFPYDLSCYGYHGQMGQENFLEREMLPLGCNSIISNPPYRAPLVDKILRKALDLVPEGGYVAFLVLGSFDSAGGRAAVLKDGGGFYARVVLPYRILWFEPKIDKNGRKQMPSKNHQWIVFKKGYTGPSKNKYLDPAAFGPAKLRPLDLHCPNGLIGLKPIKKDVPAQGTLNFEAAANDTSPRALVAAE